MDYLQYLEKKYKTAADKFGKGFKPCYKWITFNTYTV